MLSMVVGVTESRYERPLSGDSGWLVFAVFHGHNEYLMLCSGSRQGVLLCVSIRCS